MADSRTTNDVLHAALRGADGAVAAGLLAEAGKLFMHQPLTDPAQIAVHNEVKSYLLRAGFTLRLVQSSAPVKEVKQPETLDEILKEKT